MRYVAVILAGALDQPIRELEDRTPLMVGAGEHLKALARRGRLGAVRPLPADWPGDPAAALMSLFGYDPHGRFTGRGPLEAAALEVPLDRRDLAFSLAPVHLERDAVGDMPDLSPESARALVRHVQDALRPDRMEFFPADGPGSVLVWRDGPDAVHCHAPHEARGRPLREALPTGDRAESLVRLMWDSAEVLADHPANRRRRDEGRPTVDMLWPWSPGRAPELPGFGFRHGVGGACVAVNPVVRGLARLSRLRVIRPPGATGTLDTDYRAKARAVLDVLADHAFCLVHIEAPHVAGLAGDPEAKTDAIRRIDDRFFGTLLDRIGLLDDFRILVTVDHATPVAERRPAPGWMPFMLSGNRERVRQQGQLPFNEHAAEEAEWRIEAGWDLLEQLFLDPTDA